MNINVAQNPFESGKAAGAAAATLIREAIEKNGGANIILATGASQFETLLLCSSQYLFPISVDSMFRTGWLL